MTRNLGNAGRCSAVLSHSLSIDARDLCVNIFDATCLQKTACLLSLFFSWGCVTHMQHTYAFTRMPTHLCHGSDSTSLRFFISGVDIRMTGYAGAPRAGGIATSSPW